MTATAAKFSDYSALTKPRLSMLSVISSVVGYVAARHGFSWVEFFHVFVGTALCAGGVASLNQWMEAETDAAMARTHDRPIPSGKVPSGSAFVTPRSRLSCSPAARTTPSTRSRRPTTT